MAKITVNLNMTLDGVVQGPGRPGEDPRDGFGKSGWATPYFDSVMAAKAGEGMAAQPVLLFGRRTYEDFYDVWPKRKDGNMFTPVLNAARKYVVSTTLKEPLPWENSVLVPSLDALVKLKQDSPKDFVILGSVKLVQALLKRGMIDQLSLSIHPLILGQGHRLFDDSAPFQALKLLESTPSSTGVMLCNYAPLAEAQVKAA